MQNLYKGKYIIAVYDSNDEDLLGVFDNPNELEKLLDTKYAKTIIARYIKTFGTFPVIKCNKYNFYFIDIYETHNDIFKREDKEFLKFYKETRRPNLQDICKERGISQTTYYRQRRLENQQKEEHEL